MAQIHIRFDWAIKKLLRNKANFGILEGFLSVLLEKDITIVEVLESQSNKEASYDKSNVVDILAKDIKGHLFLIEVQNEKEYDYFHRMSYGQAKAISERLDMGNKYANVVKVYSVNIVYFELGHGDDYVYVGETNFVGKHSRNTLELSKKQKDLYQVSQPKDIFTTYYLLKVNNFDNVAKDELDEWIYFLKNSEIKEEFKAKGLAEAKEKMRVDSMSAEERERYERYVKSDRIRMGELESIVADALEEGMKKAVEAFTIQIEEAKAREEEAKVREEEAKKALKTIILNLKKSGMDLNGIAVIVGKSVDEINSIINES